MVQLSPLTALSITRLLGSQRCRVDGPFRNFVAKIFCFSWKTGHDFFALFASLKLLLLYTGRICTWIFSRLTYSVYAEQKLWFLSWFLAKFFKLTSKNKGNFHFCCPTSAVSTPCGLFFFSGKTRRNSVERSDNCCKNWVRMRDPFVFFFRNFFFCDFCFRKYMQSDASAILL